jgi:hypothetical protein
VHHLQISLLWKAHQLARYNVSNTHWRPDLSLLRTHIIEIFHERITSVHFSSSHSDPLWNFKCP